MAIEIRLTKRLKKIVSGGQTGVDMGALEAARYLGINCGGWCPPDGSNESGTIPVKFKLKPTPSDRSRWMPQVPRSQRTEYNVRDADGTLILCPAENSLGTGTKATRELAFRLKKPCILVPLTGPQGISSCIKWLVENEIGTLNIAGPRESEAAGIQQLTFKFVVSLVEQLRKLYVNDRKSGY